MKKFIKGLSKKVVAVVATAVLVTASVPTAFAAFGPSGRPTRAWTAAEDGYDHVVFNSFTGVPNGIGDERDFLRGVQVGRDSVWSDPVANVDNDAEVEMKIYIHNNADASINDIEGQPGIARNVTVRADLPDGSAQTQQTTAYIAADNAQPKEIFDTLDVTGKDNGYFELDYIEGSAKMYNHENGQTTAIADTLVTTGVNIGDVKGCFEYVREITFRVKVKMPGWMTQKAARLSTESSDKYRKEVNAKIGDRVEWRIWFKNSGTSSLKNVKLVDDLPSHMTVVPGSIKLTNAALPNGYTYPDTAIQKDGRQINIDIGSYAAGADAYVRYATTINNAEILRCGAHQVINVVYTTPEGYGAGSDKAKVNVIGKDKNSAECKDVPVTTTKELPKTGPASLIGLFAATSVAGGAAHNFVTRRRGER